MSKALKDLLHWNAATWYDEGDMVRIGDRAFISTIPPRDDSGVNAAVNMNMDPLGDTIFWREFFFMSVYQADTDGKIMKLINLTLKADGMLHTVVPERNAVLAEFLPDGAIVVWIECTDKALLPMLEEKARAIRAAL